MTLDDAHVTMAQMSDKEVRCICNNSCRLEGRQLTVSCCHHLQHNASSVPAVVLVRTCVNV